MNRRSFLAQSGQFLTAAAVAPSLSPRRLMPEYNQRRSLSFANDWIESVLVTGVHKLPVQEAIVVNLSTTTLRYTAGNDSGMILPWKSSMLRNCTLEEAETAALLQVRKSTNLGGIALSWDWYGRSNAGFPRDTPLYISSQDDVGEVELDPLAAFSSAKTGPPLPRRYRLKLNLWFTPEETDCGIHTGHQFLEVHTQIVGRGRMQKFRENRPDTLYEDVPMAAGFTHEPFFKLGADRSFSYPWHRYYADTDCVWMAIELHPV